LIFLNGFFVAAEMSLARVRRTRIDQLAEEGNKSAQLAQRSLDDPDRFISACQLGITLATLALGAIGEATFANDLARYIGIVGVASHWPEQLLSISRFLCFALAFGFTAFVQTVLGELIPKTWTFDRAESVILAIIKPMEYWCWLTSPILKLLNFSCEFILKLLRVQEPSRRHFVHSEEELKMLVSASHEEGVLEPEEEEMLHSVFDFSDTVASEVMTPRTDMACVAASTTVREFVELALDEGHSRIPIFEEDLDSIFGLVHIRDGLRAIIEHKESAHVRELARKVLIVPENKNLGDLLTEFKKSKTHMAIVVDEYGGTRGLVTFEDLLEELVGDIADEHEIVEDFVKEQADGSVLLDAKISLDEANDKLSLNIKDEEFNTLGGHVFGLLGREPRLGDEIATDHYKLIVEESDRHRIIKLRLVRIKAPVPLTNETNGSITKNKISTREIATKSSEAKD
jgi:putative hemolysin